MKSLLAKIAIRKAIGLYVGEHEVVLSEVASTPLGPVEIASRREPYSAHELAAVIERLLAVPAGKKRRRTPIAVGFSQSRVFFGTRPLRSGADAAPEAMVQRLLSSSNIPVNDLAIDLLRSNANKQTLASVAAARKKYVANVLAAMGHSGRQLVRAEPAACGLARAASQQHRLPRRARVVLRVFLGASDGLAVLMLSEMPLAWRSFSLLIQAEGLSVLSTVRTLQMQSKVQGMDLPLQFAVIHGRPDLHERLEKEGLATEIGTRTLWREGPEYNSAALAFGVALGCLNQDTRAFDLARTMKSRPALWDIFPWGELACQAAMVTCMGLVLFGYRHKLDEQYSASRAECGRNKICATAKAEDLKKEKKELAQKIEAVRKFVDSRILWTNYTRHIASCLPASTRLTMLDGQCTFTDGKSKAKGGKKSFVLRAESPLMPDGSLPREVGDFIVSLRTDPLLKRDFASIQLTDLKRIQASSKQEARANFTIVCLPEGGKAAAAGKEEKGEEK